MHLLVVEDDPRLGRLLKRLLSEERHLVELTISGEEALEMAELGSGIDAIVLDIGLPDIPGTEVARRLRARRSTIPILMLTARDAVDDRVAGLDAGADDYLVKPFAFEELSARLRALGRRSAGRTESGRISNGPIVLDEGRALVTVDGQPVELSRREFTLLECLLRHPGQALSRDQLLDAAWPYGDMLTHNTVDTYIHYLRQKLGADAGARIGTVRGVGYRMGDALEDIDAEVGHLTSLVDDLLLLARTDSGVVELRRAPVDLAEVAAEAAHSLRAAATERDVRLELDAAPVSVNGDPDRLRQLVAILVDNALRHAPAGSGVPSPSVPSHARRSWSTTTGRGSATRTSPTSSTASGGRRTPRPAGPGWAWPSRAGSPSTTAAGSVHRTAPIGLARASR
jgi:DNA-binding response OmpR family regulator